MWRRIGLAVFAVLMVCLVLLGGAVAAFYTVKPSFLKPYVESALSAAIGRSLHIRGDLELERGWMIRVLARDVHLENASWSDRPEMASAASIAVTVDLWALLSKQQIVLPQVTLDQANLLLERDEQGRANWQSEARDRDGPAPADRSSLPFVGKIIMHDARIDYRNDPVDQAIASNIETLIASAQDESQRITVEARGTVGDRPLDLQGIFGSYRNLTHGDEPFPVDGSFTIGKSTIILKGSIREPAELEGADLAMDLKAEDLTPALALLDVPAPEIPPFQLRGQLTRQAGIVRVDNLTGEVGDSSVRGWMAFASTGDRPKLSGDLTSERFDLDDIGGLIGLPPGAGPKETASPRQRSKAKVIEKSPYVIPDAKLSTERWGSLDVDVHFRGERVTAGKLPLERLEFRIGLDGGRLRVDPLTARIAGSPVGGMVTVDSTAKPPKVTLDVAASRLELRRFLSQFDLAKYGRGRISARIELKGEGLGLRSMLGSSNGRLALTMEEGELSALLIEALHLDLAEVLTVLFGANPGTPEETFGVRCLAADFSVVKGDAQVRTFTLDTTDSVINVTGHINLGSEAIVLNLDTTPKDNSLFASPSTIYLRGTLADPSASPDLTGTAARGAAAVAIGILLTPLASFLPFLEIGTGKDAPCEELVGTTQRKNKLAPPARK